MDPGAAGKFPLYSGPLFDEPFNLFFQDAFRLEQAKHELKQGAAQWPFGRRVGVPSIRRLSAPDSRSVCATKGGSHSSFLLTKEAYGVTNGMEFSDATPCVTPRDRSRHPSRPILRPERWRSTPPVLNPRAYESPVHRMTENQQYVESHRPEANK